ncbi:hypothetical protein B9Z55_007474 [Caenorhabditis nigoni]|uniref:BTB domain-containing protein n=1 Tax=Caenorhabditis nigoni TaxID=1611254 RepID=A0A2G5V9W6_9PELO|nr:hypothetical protein B9Z55_007474 [Caenorhabditis nigoni]
MKQLSDVILKVRERKFYVSKLYLSSHSHYFASLFSGKFQESEIEFKDVDPYDSQHYLEVLYLENGIDDDTVDGILSVAAIFDTPIIVQKCEEFLIKDSNMELIKKLELSERYSKEKLKVSSRIEI